MVQELNLNQTGLTELSCNELKEVSGGGLIKWAIKRIGLWLLTYQPDNNYSGPYPDPAHVADNTSVARPPYIGPH